MLSSIPLLLACASPERPADLPASPGDAPATVTAPAGAGAFVGSATCARCHPDEAARWEQSRHHLAQAVLDAGPPPGLAAAIAETTEAAGLDPSIADRLSHRVGWYPLQQFLVPGDDGRYAVLPLSWDARSADAGGQRWFLPRPDAVLAFSPLHWRSRQAAWNLQCAECHVTGWSKDYDVETDRYTSSWAEDGVGCEACHGAGARHLSRARAGRSTASEDPGAEGLVAGLDSRADAAWTWSSPDQRIARRDTPADPAATAVCAPCHARRTAIVAHPRPAQPLADGYHLALPLPPLYFADGQQRDEVFEWGSFQQSAMARAGVTCGDCHDPHAGGTRAEGDALCTRCHRATAYATTGHHGHPPDSVGARCVGCHMPTRTYMALDERRDHRLARPRPDLAETLGLPDPCTACHTDHDAAWAAATLDRWKGTGWRARPSLAPMIAHAATRADALLQAAADPALPSIRRAALVALAGGVVEPQHLGELRRLARDEAPLVRAAALDALAPFPAQVRAAVAAPLLDDPVRSVRIAAADRIADLEPGLFDATERAARQRATAELEESFEVNADWDDFQVRAADLAGRQGRWDAAEAILRRLLARAPTDITARANLADLLRETGRDDEAGPLLREGLELSPDAAPLHFSLGLWLVRRGRVDAALPHLQQAARLDPDQARYGLILAMALDERGRREEAIEALRAALDARPADPELLALQARWRQAPPASP